MDAKEYLDELINHIRKGRKYDNNNKLGIGLCGWHDKEVHVNEGIELLAAAVNKEIKINKHRFDCWDERSFIYKHIRFFQLDEKKECGELN